VRILAVGGGAVRIDRLKPFIGEKNTKCAIGKPYGWGAGRNEKDKSVG